MQKNNAALDKTSLPIMADKSASGVIGDWSEGRRINPKPIADVSISSESIT